ncbi:MAG: RidA family protein [Proteobacteria bacterium]|nr:RidA family protein [Pseudomonadota bacterium]
MERRRQIVARQAPEAVGPYSHAIRTQELVFSSGQIPLDPATGTLVDGGIVEQTHQVMKNLLAVLEAAGCTLGQVLKTTIYLTNMDDFRAVNEVYGSYFEGLVPPARSTVAVAALPLGARVEIDAIAQL